MASSIDDIVKAIEKGFARADKSKKAAGTGDTGAPGSPKKKGKDQIASYDVRKEGVVSFLKELKPSLALVPIHLVPIHPKINCDNKD